MGSLKKPLSRVSSDTSTTNKTFVQRGAIDLRGPYRTSQTNRTDRTDRTNKRIFGLAFLNCPIRLINCRATFSFCVSLG